MKQSPRRSLTTPSSWVLGATGLVVAALGASALVDAGGSPTPPQAATVTTVLTGRVVDEQGRPVPGATVAADGADVTTDARGAYQLRAADHPHLVTASAQGHLPRSQAVEPGRATDIRVTSEADRTVSVRFAGDTMFGRRYYDPLEDGTRRGALLAPDSSVDEHAALLTHVRPLLADADLTVVNLESPLMDEPWFDPTGARPDAFHDTKEFVFASSPQVAAALADVGVDVVSLANNHLYDALGTGLQSTVDALDRAGVPRFGAGQSLDEAWRPAVVTRKGQTFAFLGCTTITGTEHPVPYVADEFQGGAAQCTQQRLQDEVTAARQVAGTVVAMIHGGEEYENQQTELVRQLTATATAAGAAVVINGHPHVVGGVSDASGAVVAESTGNFLFDQTVWPTFLSYLLRVDVRGGVPVLTTADPLLLEGFLPRPTVGPVADAAARAAAGLVPGSARLRAPGAVLSSSPATTTAASEHRLEPGVVARLASGWWVEGSSTGAHGAPVQLGEDLLWSTGGFEDSDVDPATSGGHLWTLGRAAALSDEAACHGSAGVLLARGPGSGADVVASPAHRQLVTAGDRLSLLADVRHAAPGAVLELRWYRDTRGASSDVVSLDIPAGDFAACRQVRIDAVVPDSVVAAQPFLRLIPPAGAHRAARLALDEVRLVRWAEDGQFGRRFDTVSAPSGADIRLRYDGDVLPDLEGPFDTVSPADS